MKEISMQTVVSTINKLSRDHEGALAEIDFVVGMSRGGLIPAALIATRLNKPLVAIYINKQDEIFFDRGAWIKDKNVLFVDDICRTGSTMLLAVKKIKGSKPKSIKTLTLFTVTSITKQKTPDIAKETVMDLILPWDHDRMNQETNS